MQIFASASVGCATIGLSGHSTENASLEPVGNSIESSNAGWSFAGETSEHFEEHVRRSVPLYALGHELVASISDFFLSQGSHCYDLGCATGTLTALLAQRHSGKQIQFVGIDAEMDMVRRSQQRCRAFANVKIRCEDAIELEFEPADLVVAYYTMQFVKPKHRQELFSRIYKALNWGGGFLLFEKVRGPDARFQDMMSAIYTDFKLSQGFTGNEIVAKNRSLKGILEPFSTAGNLGLLQRAGFEDITTVMKYLCFEGFLAIK
ncbi:methyltransferase domain-containing protein [Synechococcus sp. PCC 7336]|uniref:methyltransferase domain-containing protein n=1 Tax=Synechococcus sp. PCC 7336 TaxID=195250 RepID=UPI0003723C42|nr:methyltransferase domain-containing protein [Synechococcus sp. PCC 7336]